MKAGAHEASRTDDLLVAVTGLAIIAGIYSVVISLRSDSQLLGGAGLLLAIAGMRARGLWVGLRLLLVAAGALIVVGAIYRRLALGF